MRVLTDLTWSKYVDRDGYYIGPKRHHHLESNVGLRQFYYITIHKTEELCHTWITECVLCKSITILEVIDYRAVLLIRCWSVLDRDREAIRVGVVALTTRTRHLVN